MTSVQQEYGEQPCAVGRWIRDGGFHGAITQQFRRAEPRWLLPGWWLRDTSGFAPHWVCRALAARDSALAQAIAPVCFTVFSTPFNLHTIREGVLLAGAESCSVWEDLPALPRVLISFLVPARKPRG